MPILRDLLTTTEKRGRLPRLAGTNTAAGVHVDAERSLQVSAVYACVRLISEAVAQMPVHLIRKEGRRRTPLGDHPLLPLLAEAPNPDIDAGEFWRAMVGWMLLRGNGVAYIEYGGTGRPVALWPIAATSVLPTRTSRGQLAYKVKINEAEYVPGFAPNRERVVGQDRILHYRAFGLGVWGLSPVGLARTKVGTAFAAESYGAGFYARGAHPGGALKTDQELTDEQYERLEKQWTESHGGFANSHAPAILEGGLSWENIGLPPIEAQYLETQKFTAAQIAGHIFGVPPHMIGDVDRSTSWGSGIAEQGIGFVRYTLMPWLNRLERVTRRRLLVEPNVQVKFTTAALERGDLKGRYEAYAVGKQWGWLSTNKILELEDEEPIEGGDVYLQPLNMVPAGTFDEPDRGVDVDGHRQRGDRAKSMRQRHVEAHERALRRFFDTQADEVLADLGDGRSWELRDVSREDWDDRLARLLASLGLASARDAAEEITARFDVDLDDAGFAGWMRTMGRNVARQINNATFAGVAAASDLDEVRGVFDTLLSSQALSYARTRVAESFGFGRQEAAKQTGARTKTWRTNSGNPRSSHAAMDGETVAVGDTFSNGARWPGDTANLDIDEVAGCECDMDISR